MNGTLLLITTLLGSHALVAFFVYRYVNRGWENKYKSHVLKAVKKAKEKRDEIESIDDDELGERLANWMQ